MLFLSTTTVTIERANELGDPFEATPLAVIAVAVPAHIVPAAVRLAQVVENAIQPVNAILLVGAEIQVRQNDRIVDELTTLVYRVAWSRPRTGLGLDYYHCGLMSVSELI